MDSGNTLVCRRRSLLRSGLTREARRQFGWSAVRTPYSREPAATAARGADCPAATYPYSPDRRPRMTSVTPIALGKVLFALAFQKQGRQLLPRLSERGFRFLG